MQCDVTRCVICISNNIEYLDKKESQKFYQSQISYIVNLSDLCNAIKKILGKMSCYRHFKYSISDVQILLSLPVYLYRYVTAE